MNIISDTAEDVTHNPTAKPHNVPASSESVFTPENTSDRSQDKSGKKHSFSCRLAREIQKLKGNDAGHATHEALVIKYLAHKIGKSRNDRDGKMWFYTRIEDLQKQYPYLSVSALLRIVHTLKSIGYCEIANYNKYKYDRTFWYHVPQHIRNAAEEELRYFNTDVAIELGVPTAVLIENFEYWLGQCDERGIAHRVRMSPRILVDLLPFSERTIKRGLKTMERRNYASKLSRTKPFFGKPAIKNGSNQRSTVPNQMWVVPNQISVGPNQCYDTYYKTINNPLETCSKEKAAPSPLEHFSAEQKETNAPVQSSQNSIGTDAGEQDGEEMRQDECINAGTVFTTNELALQAIPLHQEMQSTHGMSNAAFHVPGKWVCPVVSHAELHANNRTLEEVIADLPIDVQDQMQRQMLRLACLFLSQQEEATIEDWNDMENAEEIFSLVASDFTADFQQACPSIDKTAITYPILFGGALECIIGAFMWDKEKNGFYSHGTTIGQRAMSDVRLGLWQTLESIRLRLVDEEFTELKRIHASPDAHKEHDTSLTPAEKTRVFRNALSSWNTVGWLDYLNQKIENVINISKSGLELVQELFEDNPEATAADLLALMDRCIDAYTSQPRPPARFRHGIQWNARRAATSVFHFARNLKAIVRELGISNCRFELSWIQIPN